MVKSIDGKCSFCSSRNGKIGSGLKDTETMRQTLDEYTFVCIDCGKTSIVNAVDL